MKQKFIIGIDGGTQSSKVSIFDLDGNRVCSASQKLRPLHMPQPGVAEHPGDDLWDSIAKACREAMALFPYEPDSIIGVGLCTIRCCRAVLDESGQLAEPVLNWMDARIGKPYVWENPAARYVTTSSGYLAFRLTGNRKDTAANYEGQWPLNKESWQWSDQADCLDQFRLQPENLFELVLPGEVLGEVTPLAAAHTDLPLGLPVVATANDKAVEALGAGLDLHNSALVSLGTYIGGMVYGSQHTESATHYFSNLACIPNRYLYECGGVRHGMGTISWFRDLLGAGLINEAAEKGISPEELLNKEASLIAAGSDGLITLPEWLAPYDQPYKRGALLGFHAGHGRAHIYRSMLEAIALTMKNHLDRMNHETGNTVEGVIISGGGSNSDVFMQIFADVFGVACSRNVINDAASLGSAICVAVALGEAPNWGEAQTRMVKTADRFEPISNNTTTYKKLNLEVFADLTSTTDPVLQRLHTILN